MNALVLGGTRYFGIHLVRELLQSGWNVTIATRGRAKDEWGERVGRILVERTSAGSMAEAFAGREYDVVCDNLAYCSNDVKAALDAIRCGRYVMTSSASVYGMGMHIGTPEADFDPLEKPLEWCGREAHPYDEIKQLAECALFQAYGAQNAAAARFPVVLGEDDYTGRLRFYAEHVIRGIPMFVDDPDAQLGFIGSHEAGRFLAFLAEQKHTGPVNGCSAGTISPREIIGYVEKKCGRRAVFSEGGDTAPFNGRPDYSLDTGLAEKWGFRFAALRDWIYPLLDVYTEQAAR